MRSIVLAFALAVPAVAAAQTPTPTPAPAASPTPTAPAEDPALELPTMTDADPVPDAPPDGWEAGARASGMLLGLRGGFHAFEPSGFGDGGFAFEATAAMPLFGPMYLGLVAGYHTGWTPAGHDAPDPKLRFFDAQYGAVEGQYRRNVGRLNVFGALGAGVLAATSSEVTLRDGTPSQTRGSGAVGHVALGALLPFGGRYGLVGQVKYSFAPVEFEESKETLGMGGLTLAAGIDFAF